MADEESPSARIVKGQRRPLEWARLRFADG